MINLETIKNARLDDYIKDFDERISYIKTNFNIELKTYGNILRIALNTLKTDSFDAIIERININHELEWALTYAGGYTIDFLKENNPKITLTQIVTYLKNQSEKLNKLILYLQDTQQKIILIADTNDVDFIKSRIRNNKVSIISFAGIKKAETRNKHLVFYSFNGKKDFDLVYNLACEVTLIIYGVEYLLYKKQLFNRIKLIEDEIKSNDRFTICDISYEAIPDNPIHISETIEDIVSRLDGLSNNAYDVYKDESELILDEIEEKLIYKISSANSTFFLDSNDTIFNTSGDLIKVRKINIGDKIRIYPRERLAENLYQVAVETEPEIFGKVEETSKCWKLILEKLSKQYIDTALYQKLKERGLRVLPTTVESYLKGHRKFPMFNSDIKAIIELYYLEKEKVEYGKLITNILKSKATYNSTMIALGRGLKQELKLFLKDRQIGEILEKRKFNAVTLQTFVNEYMPLITVLSKETQSDEKDQMEVYGQLQQL